MSVTVNGTSGIVFNDSTTQGTSAFYGGLAFRNRIINGAMVIDQRNAGASVTPTTSGTYTLDRWQSILTQTSKYSVEQTITGVSAPVGFTDYLGVTSLSSYPIVTGDIFAIRQHIEGFNCADLGWGTANAQTITISFWVRSSLTGTFGGSINNSAFNRSYPFTYTVSSANTWEQKTITIAGDTSGTWLTNNSAGIVLGFSLGSGATYTGTAGSWSGSTFTSATGATSVVGTSGATFYITGVQLEKGSTATSFDYRPYGTELQLAQRYYYRIVAGTAGQVFGSGYNISTSASFVLTPLKVPMRTAPTALEQSGTAGDYRVNNLATATTCTSVPALYVATTEIVTTTFTTGATMTAGQGSFGSSVNTTAYLGWSAEL